MCEQERKKESERVRERECQSVKGKMWQRVC